MSDVPLRASPPTCHIVPPYLLAQLARAGSPELAARARHTLELDRSLRRYRPFRGPSRAAPDSADPSLRRTISDADNREELPGRLVRSEDQPPTGDPAVDEAYDGLGATFAFLLEAYGRSSLDGAGGPLDATVHFGRDYDNAFWDGERMVFGDGDGEVFLRFTASLSVIGHELAHGVTQFTANLTYYGQSGALNESVSDVIGALVEQYDRKQSAAEASWLIGAELFGPDVQGRALRSLADPGTAYDDDLLGRDPQPGHLDDYIETDEDDGGVHLNSGIPNRAFCLAATELGGNAWERAGQVWYDVLTGGGVSVDADFAEFATATVRAAQRRYPESAEADAVRAGWEGVGVSPW